jgi:hypothetical protein
MKLVGCNFFLWEKLLRLRKVKLFVFFTFKRNDKKERNGKNVVLKEKNGKWSQKEKEKKVFFDFLANFL